MAAVPAHESPTSVPSMFGWPRLRVVLSVALVMSLLIYPGWKASYLALLVRLLLTGLMLLFAFGLFERWPRRLPEWIARWPLQVLAVAIAVPFAVALAYALTTFDDPQHWWLNQQRFGGWRLLTGLGVLMTPWIAISALLRHIRGEAQRQALAFELERSEFERRALDARLRLLQAQVEPHFLFNTLANVRELVDSGSMQASSVLGSLIAYLRAAVPRLQGSATTMAQELDLVRSYLEVMHMRMPDRLQFSLHADEAALPLSCPPMTLLTLVENAVRHGIDPSEEGGRIEVRVRVRDGRCRAEVIDTGAGLREHGDGLGTGLINLRERLLLAFGGDAALDITPIEPHGVCAELDFPARGSKP